MILFGASTDIVGLYAQSAQYPVQSKLVFNQVSRANKSRLWFRIRAKLISAPRYRDSHGGELSPAWLADNRKNTSLSSCGLVNAGGARVWGRDRQPPPPPSLSGAPDGGASWVAGGGAVDAPTAHCTLHMPETVHLASK